MSVQSAAAHARPGQVGRAEQMVRSATGALSSFAVVQRVGAGPEVLTVAEQLLVAALVELRSVQQQLAAAPGREDDGPEAGASAPLAPRPSAPAAPAAATVSVLWERRTPTPLMVYGSGAGGAASRPS